VNTLLEESTLLRANGNLGGALERAKDAGKKERALCKHREANNLGEQQNIDLTYSVCFNLAHQVTHPPPRPRRWQGGGIVLG